MREKNSMKCCANLGNKYEGDPGNDQIGVQGRNHEPNTASPNSPRPKKARKVKSKVKSMFIIYFFILREFVHKESVLISKTVNSAYYCGVL
jgi:hypothetical protein